MTFAEEMHALADQVAAQATAAAALADATMKDLALDRIQAAAASGGYSLVCRPSGTGSNSYYTLAQADSLEPYLVAKGFTIARSAFMSGFQLIVTW